MKKDKFIIYTFGISLAFLVISGLTAFLGLPTETGDLILRFSNFEEEGIWRGGVSIFYGILSLVLVMAAVNFILARYIYDREKFLSYVLAAGTAVITFLFLIATGSIAFLN